MCKYQSCYTVYKLFSTNVLLIHVCIVYSITVPPFIVISEVLLLDRSVRPSLDDSFVVICFCLNVTPVGWYFDFWTCTSLAKDNYKDSQKYVIDCHKLILFVTNWYSCHFSNSCILALLSEWLMIAVSVHQFIYSRDNCLVV